MIAIPPKGSPLEIHPEPVRLKTSIKPTCRVIPFRHRVIRADFDPNSHLSQLSFQLLAQWHLERIQTINRRHRRIQLSPVFSRLSHMVLSSRIFSSTGVKSSA